MGRDAVQLWAGLQEYRGLIDALHRGAREVAVSGLPAAAAVPLGLALRVELERPVVWITADEAQAEATWMAVAAWAAADDAPLLLPPREFLPFSVVAEGPEIRAARLQALSALGLEAPRPPLLVLPITALRRQLAPPAVFRAAGMTLAVGDRVGPGQLAARLVAGGYERQPLVEGPGGFALRGGILDVFPLTVDQPLRFEFDGETLVSLRRFAADTQRSLESLSAVTVPPAREVPVPDAVLRETVLARLAAALDADAPRLGGPGTDARTRLEESIRADIEALGSLTAAAAWERYLPFAHRPASVLEYARWRGRDPLCLVLDAATAMDAVRTLHRHEEERLAWFLTDGRILSQQAAAFGLPLDWQADAGPRGATLFVDPLGRQIPGVEPQERVQMAARSAPPLAGQWSLALDTLRRWQRGGYRVVCWAGGRERASHTLQELQEAGINACRAGQPPWPMPGQVAVATGRLPVGFEVPGLSLAVLGETELFGRRPRPARVRRATAGATQLQSYEDLQVGDYVVHSAHGIGQYLGTSTLTVQGKARDYLVLRYDGTDRLYVPTDQIGLVQKYIGGEGRAPRISRLGGAEWSKVKQRVKESVRRMAEELIALYAARQALSGHAFSADTPWQREFEDAFPYEETPDQRQAILEIKQDMERAVPMDRLLCGDVGYGKTEVAMRAAFKAIADGRQVAVLVPTTILAEQHFLTFSERFRGFPIQIRMLSRFRNRREQEEAITALRRGTADLVIGTHRLLQGDVDFKNLGLVVIDEEHRFGVAHKERLKQLRQSVDVLTMTATPIPRTLHMAMAGVRDMSVITTPPENRYPIETVVVEWSPALVREALSRELARRGQVYYLHNRVQGISAAQDRIRSLAPEADVIVAHGQMPEDQLESVMAEFWRGEHQVLLATTIIESGLDIPNANTLIVEDADRLGLAQLYQIRGRVGRSSRVAYAYFTYRRDKALTEIASKRLEAIKQFTELGSGFKIALRDLEIRGAGNILGPEQHGFVAAVGFDLYAQLLEEAVRDLKGERAAPAHRATVELAVDAFIDDRYIPEAQVKLEFYKKIHAAAASVDLAAVEEELRDRFGAPPVGVDHLLRLTRIRLLAQDLGLLGIVQEGRRITFSLPNYAASLLTRLQDLAVRSGRRLRVRTTPKPQLEWHLDGVDDATVLAAAEGCLKLLTDHPQVQAWRQGLEGAVERGDVAVEVASVLRPPAPVPLPARARPTPPPSRPAPVRPMPASVDRLAASAGWVRVESPVRAPRKAGPTPGRPLRAAVPPGLVVSPARDGRRQGTPGRRP